jgi:hypothetical protein
MAEKNLFELLREKSILAILDGDIELGEIESDEPKGNIKISMPYLSGPVLCSISARFGLPVTYGSQSRWVYLDDIWAYSIKNHRESDLLSFLFSKEQFAEKLKGYSKETVESAYAKIVEAVIKQINDALYFGGNELVRISNQFIIRKIGSTVTVVAPTIKIIDRAYITSISERAFKDVADKNYDSAITKSRTLLEEVFCYVIEKKGETPCESGDINRLYNQVKQLYNMHQNKDIDKRVNGLLSGLEKILSAIAEMRNKGSDSHGIGAKRINIADHHARLFVNSAITMADFVLAVGDQSAE